MIDKDDEEEEELDESLVLEENLGNAGNTGNEWTIRARAAKISAILVLETLVLETSTRFWMRPSRSSALESG